MAATQTLAGFHAVIARLRQAPDSIREIYVEAQRRDKRMQSLIEQATAAGRSVHPVGADRLDGLAGGSRHQGVVAVAAGTQPAVDHRLQPAGHRMAGPGAGACPQLGGVLSR